MDHTGTDSQNPIVLDSESDDDTSPLQQLSPPKAVPSSSRTQRERHFATARKSTKISRAAAGARPRPRTSFRVQSSPAYNAPAHGEVDDDTDPEWCNDEMQHPSPQPVLNFARPSSSGRAEARHSASSASPSPDRHQGATDDETRTPSKRPSIDEGDRSESPVKRDKQLIPLRPPTAAARAERLKELRRHEQANPSSTGEEKPQHRRPSDSSEDDFEGVSTREGVLQQLKTALQRLQDGKMPDGSGRALDDVNAGETVVAKLSEYIQQIEEDRQEQYIAIAGNNGDGKSELIHTILRATEQTPNKYRHDSKLPHQIWNNLADHFRGSNLSKSELRAVEKASNKASRELTPDIHLELQACNIQVETMTPELAARNKEHFKTLRDQETRMYKSAVRAKLEQVVHFILPKAMERSATTTNRIEIRYGNAYALKIVFESKAAFVQRLKNLHGYISPAALEAHRRSFAVQTGQPDSGKNAVPITMSDDSEDDVASNVSDVSEGQERWTTLELLQYLLFYSTANDSESYKDYMIEEDFDPERLAFDPEVEKNFGKVFLAVGKSKNILADRHFVRKALKQKLAPPEDGQEAKLPCIIKSITLYCPSTFLWDDRVLVDVPGFNDSNPLRRVELSRGMDCADVVVALIKRSWSTASDMHGALKTHGVNAKVRRGTQRLLVLRCNEKAPPFKGAEQVSLKPEDGLVRGRELSDVYSTVFNARGPVLTKQMEAKPNACAYVSARYFLGGCILRHIQACGESRQADTTSEPCDDPEFLVTAFSHSGMQTLLHQLEKLTSNNLLERIRSWIEEDFRLFRDTADSAMDVEIEEVRMLAEAYQGAGHGTEQLLKDNCIKAFTPAIATQKTFWEGEVPDFDRLFRPKLRTLKEKIEKRNCKRIKKARRGLVRDSRGRTSDLNSELRSAVDAVLPAVLKEDLQPRYDHIRNEVTAAISTRFFEQVKKRLEDSVRTANDYPALKGLLETLEKRIQRLVRTVVTKRTKIAIRPMISVCVDEAIRTNSFPKGRLDAAQASEKIISHLEAQLSALQKRAKKQIAAELGTAEQHRALWRLLRDFFKTLARPSKATRHIVGHVESVISRLFADQAPPDASQVDDQPKYVRLRQRAAMSSLRAQCKRASDPVQWYHLGVTISDLSHHKHDESPLRIPGDVRMSAERRDQLRAFIKKKLIDEKKLANPIEVKGPCDSFLSALEPLFRVSEDADVTCQEALQQMLVVQLEKSADDGKLGRVQEGNTIEVLQAFAEIYRVHVVIHDLDHDVTYRLASIKEPPQTRLAQAYHFVLYRAALFPVVNANGRRPSRADAQSSKK